MCHHGIRLIIVFSSQISGHQNIDPHAGSYGKSQHQRGQRKSEGHRGQGVLTQPRHEKAVHKIIGILQKHGKQRR